MQQLLFAIDAPTNVTATALSSTSVEVTWKAPSPFSNVTDYVIVYSTSASYASNGNLTVNGINTTNGTLIDLEENTFYTIIVQAISSSGRSGDSEEATVTTYTDGK